VWLRRCQPAPQRGNRLRCSPSGSGVPRDLKHRPYGTVRVVPIPAVLADLLHRHLHAFGTAPDGRLFRGARGGMLSESVYGLRPHLARRPRARAWPPPRSPAAPMTYGTPPCPPG